MWPLALGSGRMQRRGVQLDHDSGTRGAGAGAMHDQSHHKHHQCADHDHGSAEADFAREAHDERRWVRVRACARGFHRSNTWRTWKGRRARHPSSERLFVSVELTRSPAIKPLGSAKSSAVSGASRTSHSTCARTSQARVSSDGRAASIAHSKQSHSCLQLSASVSAPSVSALERSKGGSRSHTGRWRVARKGTSSSR